MVSCGMLMKHEVVQDGIVPIHCAEVTDILVYACAAENLRRC